MKWPWVSRKRYTGLFVQHAKDLHLLDALGAQRIAEIVAQMDALQVQHVRELSAREAAIVYEQQAHAETKATLARMTVACRDFEQKLRDCKDPPISRKELLELTKRHSFVVAQVESLQKHNAELEARLQNGK